MEHQLIKEQLASLATSCFKECFLVAPFITRPGLRVISDLLPISAKITLITRWHEDELKSGVSDCLIYKDLGNRNFQIRLLDNLHAKYFRFDSNYIFGSVNLTLRALGLGHSPNLEVLSSILESDVSSALFETDVINKSKPVSTEMFEKYLAIQNKLRNEYESKELNYEESCSLENDYPDVFGFLASISLIDFDGNQSFELLLQQSDSNGLKEYFPESCLSNVVKFSSELIRQINFSQELELLNSFLAVKERRFGEVKSYIRDNTDLDIDSSQAWRNLIDNLLYLVPDKYTHRRNPHSELVQFVGTLRTPKL